MISFRRLTLILPPLFYVLSFIQNRVNLLLSFLFFRFETMFVSCLYFKDKIINTLDMCSKCCKLCSLVKGAPTPDAAKGHYLPNIFKRLVHIWYYEIYASKLVVSWF